MNTASLSNLLKHRSGTFAVVDIGTSKIAAMIVHSDGENPPAILGIGQHVASGMHRGEVTDIKTLGLAIGKAVEGAEHMAGISIKQVVVGISGANQRTDIIQRDIDITSGQVSKRDIQRLKRLVADHQEDDGRITLHRLPIAFTLDQVSGISDPINLAGKRLSLAICTINAAAATLHSIQMAVEYNHLRVEKYVSNIYASGLSALAENERELGTTIIEIGGGMTSIGYFVQGQIRYIDSIPHGGGSITQDIAKMFSIPMNEAERIKTLKGSVLAAAGDSHEKITMPMVGHDADASQPIEIGMLGDVIRARVEEILEQLIKRLDTSQYASAANQRIVIVGGVAELQGMEKYTSTMIGRFVRVGQPQGVRGLTEATKGAAYASTVGLILYRCYDHLLELTRDHANSNTRWSSNIKDWIINNIWETGSR